MCSTEKSGIPNDPRKSFYSKVEVYSQKYALDIGLGGSYGHVFKPLTLDELVRFDGVIVRDGVRGGSNGAVHRRWELGADHDKHISRSISYSRYLAVRQVIKLNDNSASPKRGEPLYNPCYKFNMIYDAIISYTNCLPLKAEDSSLLAAHCRIGINSRITSAFVVTVGTRCTDGWVTGRITKGAADFGCNVSSGG
jgi:hypothetical protein